MGFGISPVENLVHLSQQVIAGVGIVSAMNLRKNSQKAVPLQEQDSFGGVHWTGGIRKNGLGQLADI
jgi:hypothetical protein